MPFSSARSCFLLLAILVPPTSAFFFDLLDRIPVFFPRLRCSLAFALLGFEFGNFDEYEVFFRDDSVLQLPQAGSFLGALHIEEYAKFSFRDFSPFLTSTDTSAPLITESGFVDYNRETGQCEFISVGISSYFFDPEFANPRPEFNGLTMFKLFFDLKENYIKRINIFFPADLIRIFLEVALNTDKARGFVCETIMGPSCSEILVNTTTMDDCLANLAALPGTEGDEYHFDGNSQSCRAVHSVFAATNSEHCPHLSFSPLKDEFGSLVCQNSALLDPASLFRESDFATYTEFAERMGFDPEIGHNSVA